MIGASAVLSARSAARLPASLAEVLVGLGTVANELSFALAETRLREHQATLAVVRVNEREDLNHPAPESDMIVDWHAATRDHAERLVAIYAHIAAAYAVHAIETFTMLARGEQPCPWQAIVPSDILTMPDVIVPLVQLPDDAGAEDDRRHIPRYNKDLRQAHNQLVQAATGHVRHDSPTILDKPEQLADRDNARDLDDDLPTALHVYAATAISAFDILTRGGNGGRS
jgi:hypothetical protein